MGKRKHHDEEEHLARKIRKLEKKMSRVRRRQRERSYRSSSSNLERDRYRDDGQCSVSSQEVPQNEGAPYEDLCDATSHSKTIDAPSSAPGIASLTEPMATYLPTSADAPPLEDVLTESVQELEPDILCLLGEEPVREEKFGDNVHKDIASRWTDILINGLKDEIKSDLLKGYYIPGNLKLAQAPTLNPEIRAAVNEGAVKRDNILTEKQKILSTVISCAANIVTSVLNTGSRDEDIKRQQTLKSLSDAGRLLCHIHYNESETRRNFLLSCLNKEIKDNVKDLKRDDLLFGNELKHTAAKPKLPPKNVQPKNQRQGL